MRKGGAKFACALVTTALALFAVSGCAQSETKWHSNADEKADVTASAQEQEESEAVSDAKEDSEEEAADEELISEPTLDPSEVSGYWVVDGAVESSTAKDVEKGFLIAYWFDEEGNFEIRSNILGLTYDRVGTYRIEGDKVYVSIPEGELQTTDTASLQPKGIEDGEITIDGDTLTTRAISTKGELTTAYRTSDEQYQEFFDQVSALGPKDAWVGETVTTSTVTFTIDSFSFMDEIYPSDTSGYYHYMADEEGKTYLLAKVTFTNDGTEYCNPGYSTEVSFKVGENSYVGAVEVDGGSRFSKSYSVEAKETSTLYLYCSVPDAAIGSGDVKMTWEIPSDQQYMNAYWDSRFPHDTFTVTM